MTVDGIKAALGDDVNVRRSDNDEYWFVSRTIIINGQAHSLSRRLPDNPSDTDLELAKTDFEAWEQDLRAF